MINRVNSAISKPVERLLARLASRDSATESRFVAVGSNAARSADAEMSGWRDARDVKGAR